MDDTHEQRFHRHRDLMCAVARRMLGSVAEADDAVQETWLRFAAADADGIDNLPAWLTTVVSRVCLDILRARRVRREDLAGQEVPDRADPAPGSDPEQDAVLADSVGRALLVVLDRLGPDERVAFVLHDMFAVPFDQIAPVVERSVATTKKLASRARGKVRGHPGIPAAELVRRRRIVAAFVAATRAGDIDAVLEVLAPDVVRRADRYAIGADRPAEVRGARTVAGEIAVFGRAVRYAEALVVNDSVGLAIAPGGRMKLVLVFEFGDGKITEYRLVADPAELGRLELSLLPAESSAG